MGIAKKGGINSMFDAALLLEYGWVLLV